MSLNISECRGYAHLGIGAYVINTSAKTEPAELIISIATEEEKAGRAVGEDRPNPEGHVLQPDMMVVRLRFENAAGLDALEKQLRYLRAEHFGGPDDAVAKTGLVAALQATYDALTVSYPLHSCDMEKRGAILGQASAELAKANGVAQ